MCHCHNIRKTQANDNTVFWGVSNSNTQCNNVDTCNFQQTGVALKSKWNQFLPNTTDKVSHLFCSEYDGWSAPQHSHLPINSKGFCISFKSASCYLSVVSKARIGWQLEAQWKTAISFMLWDVNNLTYKPDRHSYLNQAFLETNKPTLLF